MKVVSSTSSNLSSPKGGVQGARSGDTSPVANRSTSGTPASSTGGAEGSAGDANVNLSALSSHMRALAASGSADIDVAQVESIKQAIKDGTLSIDTGKIADGILETARNLLQKPQSSGD